MSIARKLIKTISEECAIPNSVSIGTANDLHSTPPADPNGIVPDKSNIKKDKKDEKLKKSTVASRILEESDIKKELGAIDAWKYQLSMDMNPDKITADQLKMSEVPQDILEILLLADPASANSFIYRVQGTEPDKYCRILNKLPDNITVALRSGSIVVFDNKNNAFSYNREALTNLLLSKRKI